MGGLRFRKEVHFRGTVESRAPAEEFPSFARPLLGDELVIRQEEHWVSPNRAELEVTVPGKPGGMKAT